MKAIIKIKKEVDVKYLKIDVGVRYWEDGIINGEEDNDLSVGEGTKPRMPFAVFDNDGHFDKFNGGYRWQPIIDIESGFIVDWPAGVKAKVHYKICDDGTYSLLNKDMEEIVKVNSYVPYCLGEEGDYIVLAIEPNGHIENFHFNEDDVQDIIKGDFSYGKD